MKFSFAQTDQSVTQFAKCVITVHYLNMLLLTCVDCCFFQIDKTVRHFLLLAACETKKE